MSLVGKSVIRAQHTPPLPQKNVYRLYVVVHMCTNGDLRLAPERKKLRDPHQIPFQGESVRKCFPFIFLLRRIIFVSILPFFTYLSLLL